MISLSINVIITVFVPTAKSSKTKVNDYIDCYITGRFLKVCSYVNKKKRLLETIYEKNINEDTLSCSLFSRSKIKNLIFCQDLMSLFIPHVM